MVTITADAEKFIDELLEKNQKTGWGIKVYLSGYACSGPQFGMSFQEKAAEGEKVDNSASSFAMFYDEETVTDQPERAIVAEIIREKALHALDDEIPHGIAVYIDRMKERRGQNIIDIDATIVCERDSHKGIIIGKQGAMLKKIGSNARYELEQMLEQKVNLKLWVKVKKDWRDSDFLVKNFGYDKKKLEL